MSMIEVDAKKARIEKLQRLFSEILARLSNNDKGEITISWNHSSVHFRFTEWILPDSLTRQDQQ